MRILINEKLSEHKFKTPEGYLICTDAILARTGKQQYTRDEAFGDGSDEIIDIDRSYDEVFAKKTLASFENKPITIEHPSEDVNIDNYKDYAVGFIRDVHEGNVDGNPVMLGNLVITDKEAIEKIESGEMTDLSCGYDCDIKDDNGQYHFSNIRGNHLALCKEGRAGVARIVDSKLKDKLSYNTSSSDDKYLDEIERLIYSYAHLKVDAMLTNSGNTLKIASKTSKGFSKKQLDDIRDTLNKYVDVSNIVVSNPDSFDSNVVARIVDSKVIDGHNVRTVEWIDNDVYVEYDADERKYYLASDNDRYGWRNFDSVGQAIAFYKYNKSDVRNSILDSIKDSKVEDAEYTYKLTKKKNDYDEYVIQAYKNGKKNEDATYYTDDWDDAINTLKSIAKQEKLTFRQQGSVFIADNKAKAFNDSKESMTMSDAIKMIDLIKKVSK